MTPKKVTNMGAEEFLPAEHLMTLSIRFYPFIEDRKYNQCCIRKPSR